jgi:hypothetical protein
VSLDDEQPITSDTVPMPTWTRRWKNPSGEYRQGLYTVRVPGGPMVGVRVSIHLNSATHDMQSYATAEVFDGTQWHAVAALPPALMETEARVPGSGFTRYWSDERALRDTARLLEDVRVAYTYRASSYLPRTTHEAPAEAR